MYHFFANPQDITDKDIYIKGGDFNHIKNVLRMKEGETVSVSDGISDREYRCHIEKYETDRVHLRLDFIKEAGVELPVKVYLFQCLPKADKMEFIIQKAVELGVHGIIPVASKRSVVKLDKKKAQAKCERWQKISESAAKQSKRAEIPQVHEVMGFDEAVDYAKKLDRACIAYELEKGFDVTRKLIDGMRNDLSVGVFIGPEGGFDEAEIKRTEEAGFVSFSMGRRILRTETAALVFLSWLVYNMEE